MVPRAVLCCTILLSLAAAGYVSAAPAPAPSPPSSPPPSGSAFGTVSAETSTTTVLRETLTVASVESGHSNAPVPVQQAFLSTVMGKPIAGGTQTAGYGAYPWTTGNASSGANASAIPASTEAIISSDGTLPQCEVTVQVSPAVNGSTNSTILNLIYTNWDAKPIPSGWTTTIINSVYRPVLDSANINITVAVQRVIQGTVSGQNGSVPANGTRSVPITLILDAVPGPDVVPSAIFQDGQKCVLVNIAGAAFATAAAAPEAALGAEAAETAVRVLGNNIIGVDGNVLQMRGVNWFGFDDGVTMLEGLWVEGKALTRDMATITQRIRLLGFNAIRLPFSMQDLFNLAPRSASASCTFVSSSDVLQSVTPPGGSGRRRRLLQTAGCQDLTPPGGYTCAQQKTWGACSQSWMTGFCDITCGRCTPGSPTACTDTQPPGGYTCAQQKSWGACTASWMTQGNYCAQTCGLCSATPAPAPAAPAAPASGGCTDNATPGYSCAQQKSWGACSAGWMTQGNYCAQTCGRCTPSQPATAPAAPAPGCTDVATPGYTCAQQQAWGNCAAGWMMQGGYCAQTCGHCTPVSPAAAPAPAAASCADTAPPGGYTCTQQKSWGACTASWMTQGNYCMQTCGYCPASPSPAAPAASACTDVATPGYTCAQQKSFGACSASWMTQGGYCAQTCGRCSASAPPPSPPSATPAAPAPPSSPAGPISVALPFPPTGGTAGICNSYLPSDSTFNRFMFTVQFLAYNGFYLILDNQFNFDTTAITDQNAWIQGWTRIAQAVNADKTISNRVFYDILNEPDAYGVRFEAANGRPGMQSLYFAAFGAIAAVNPASVFLIEGLGQQSYGGLNWGDGLITQESIIQQDGLSDPNPFFQQLLASPYRRQVIVAVHVYPPAISKATTATTAATGLYQKLSLSHGYLNKQGYCYNGDCQVFPVIYGEFGSAMQDPRDLQWLTDLVPYMANTGAGNDGQHNPITSWFWWAWPTNAGDTKGIVDSDWLTILWNKIQYLQQVGLQPWYVRQGGAS